MIELKDINIKFGKKECIRNGNFIAYSNQITGIYGESGTGKSSLLYLIAMLANHDLYYYKYQLLKHDKKQRSKFRNKHISFISQNSQLIETISVAKNIEFYLQQSNLSISAEKLLKKVNLSDKGKAMPGSLSGGERQRAAIACALAKDSDIIIGDEITSALDKENKQIIIKLLKECANMGKTVIIVSHEKDIIDHCDRIYHLDHLKLTLEKESKVSEENKVKNIKVKINNLKVFETLFHSNRKYNFRRLLFSLMIVIIIFISSIIYYQSSSIITHKTYSTKHLMNNKLYLFNNQSGVYTETKFGYGAHQADYQSPLGQKIIDQVEQISNIETVYDYYQFDYYMTKNNSFTSTMDIKVLRDGKEVERHRQQFGETGLIFDDDDYPFSIFPYYPEDPMEGNGIYINTNMAYYYNIEIGDTVELKVNVPYAMARFVGQSEINESTQEPYDPVSCLGELADYKAKVAGIIEANSYYSEIYFPYQLMEEMISKQVNRYHSGEIKVNKGVFEGYATIIDLQPYAKAIFVDKYENILKVQNEINEISDDVYAYNEYQSVLQLDNENQQLISDTIKIMITELAVFITGVIIIEILYLRKYRSVYMNLNLTGYPKKSSVLMFHSLYQLLMMSVLGMILYLSASIPLIFLSAGKTDLFTWLDNYPEWYQTFVLYGVFTWQKFIFFSITVIVAVLLTNYGMKKYYDRQSIVKWLRGK